MRMLLLSKHIMPRLDIIISITLNSAHAVTSMFNMSGLSLSKSVLFSAQPTSDHDKF